MSAKGTRHSVSQKRKRTVDGDEEDLLLVDKVDANNFMQNDIAHGSVSDSDREITPGEASQETETDLTNGDEDEDQEDEEGGEDINGDVSNEEEGSGIASGLPRLIEISSGTEDEEEFSDVGINNHRDEEYGASGISSNEQEEEEDEDISVGGRIDQEEEDEDMVDGKASSSMENSEDVTEDEDIIDEERSSSLSNIEDVIDDSPPQTLKKSRRKIAELVDQIKASETSSETPTKTEKSRTHKVATGAGLRKVETQLIGFSKQSDRVRGAYLVSNEPKHDKKRARIAKLDDDSDSDVDGVDTSVFALSFSSEGPLSESELQDTEMNPTYREEYARLLNDHKIPSRETWEDMKTAELLNVCKKFNHAVERLISHAKPRIIECIDEDEAPNAFRAKTHAPRPTTTASKSKESKVPSSGGRAMVLSSVQQRYLSDVLVHLKADRDALLAGTVTGEDGNTHDNAKALDVQPTDAQANDVRATDSQEDKRFNQVLERKIKPGQPIYNTFTTSLGGIPHSIGSNAESTHGPTIQVRPHPIIDPQVKAALIDRVSRMLDDEVGEESILDNPFDYHPKDRQYFSIPGFPALGYGKSTHTGPKFAGWYREKFQLLMLNFGRWVEEYYTPRDDVSVPIQSPNFAGNASVFFELVSGTKYYKLTDFTVPESTLSTDGPAAQYNRRRARISAFTTAFYAQVYEEIFKSWILALDDETIQNIRNHLKFKLENMWSPEAIIARSRHVTQHMRKREKGYDKLMFYQREGLYYRLVTMFAPLRKYSINPQLSRFDENCHNRQLMLIISECQSIALQFQSESTLYKIVWPTQGMIFDGKYMQEVERGIVKRRQNPEMIVVKNTLKKIDIALEPGLWRSEKHDIEGGNEGDYYMQDEPLVHARVSCTQETFKPWFGLADKW